MKIFISQPMKNKTNEEIKAERNYLINCAKKEYGDNVEAIDSFFEDAPHDANPLWYLGESIKKLSEADVAVFSKDWESARGCIIEHKCALEYGVEIMESYSY